MTAPDRNAPGAQPATARPEDDHPEKGNTRVNQEDGAVPRLPHERDASVDSQPAHNANASSPETQAAYRDAASGRPDTGRAPVTDALYNDQVRPDDNAAR